VAEYASNAVGQEPVGVVLAGGRGRRLGGAKATVELCGRPLISYPLEALRAVLDEVAIVAKPDTRLPSLPGVTVWIEPEAPHHPLVGIVHALGLADGRPVVVCAGDLPFVTSELVATLTAADADGAPAVIVTHGGELQPLLGRYHPEAARPLAAAMREQAAVRATVAGIGPRLVEIEDPELLFNVNAPEDLLQAAAILDRRRRSSIRT
jgi:molybdopterin-guanine dinucleotide biosynthesis protein A